MRKAVFFVDQAYVCESNVSEHSAIAEGTILQINGKDVCVQSVVESDTDPENLSYPEGTKVLEVYTLTVDN
jgi:hypothetical protein